MAKVRDEHKQTLMASGQWADFVAFREELAARGEKPCDANRKAVEKFLGEQAVEKPRKRVSSKETPPRPVEGPLEETPPCPSGLHPELEAGLAALDYIGGPMPPAIPVPFSAFANKPACTELENVLWVMDNVRRTKANPEECPSARAWGLLCSCRESPLFYSNFVKDHYGKAVVKQTSDAATGGDDFDGAVQVELIDEILAVGERSRGGEAASRRVHGPEDAGSSPAPATNLQEATV